MPSEATAKNGSMASAFAAAKKKTNVGSGLNKALAAVQDANPNTLQDVLKGINFNRRVGQ